jgi:hypothetical protein
LPSLRVPASAGNVTHANRHTSPALGRTSLDYFASGSPYRVPRSVRFSFSSLVRRFSSSSGFS